jgi:hypothetical protein
MRVKIYDVDQATGAEEFRDECELVEAFGDGNADPEYYKAIVELATVGRYWAGGGAAPLVRLVRAGITVS